MITAPRTGMKPLESKALIHDPNDVIVADVTRDRWFVVLEDQLANILETSYRLARKHWPDAEREQYPFWIGIIVIALLGILGMSTREVQWLGLTVAIVMLVGLVVLVGFYLRSLGGRFNRQWSALAADGELFRFLRDSGAVLGHPIEIGRPDEHLSTHLDIEFPIAVSAVEAYIKSIALPDPVPPDAPPGIFVPSTTLKNPAGGEAHRVYEVEYRGSVSAAPCIRVSKADSGADVTIGFPVRPAGAESRDRVASALQGRLQDRFIAAKILGDIRSIAGVSPMPIPALETPAPVASAQMSRAI